MPDFILSEPFFIDDAYDNFQEMIPQQIFVLGVEWEMCRLWMDNPELIGPKIIHSTNKDRIEKMAEIRGIKLKFKFVNDDFVLMKKI